MADETQYATKGYTSIIRWCDPKIKKDAYIVQRTLNTATAKAGDVMSADAQTIGLVAEAEESHVQIAGILMGPTSPGDNYDLDDVIDTGSTVDILRPTGGRMMVSVVLDSTATTTADIEEFDWLRVGNTAGHVELFVYAAADSTDCFEIVVGKAAEVMANHTSDDRVLTIWY